MAARTPDEAGNDPSPVDSYQSLRDRFDLYDERILWVRAHAAHAVSARTRDVVAERVRVA